MSFYWSSLATRHPETGAWRGLGADLLAEAFLAPRLPDPDWEAALSAPGAPWADSFASQPRQVRAVVERGFTDLVCATETARLDRVDPTALPEGRARRHLAALLEVGRSLGGLPHDLAVVRHVLETDFTALEPLPVCPPRFGEFETPLEAALHGRLQYLFGAAEARPDPAATAPAASALAHLAGNITKTAARVSLDETVRLRAGPFHLFTHKQAVVLAADLLQRVADRAQENVVGLQDCSIELEFDRRLGTIERGKAAAIFCGSFDPRRHICREFHDLDDLASLVRDRDIRCLDPDFTTALRDPLKRIGEGFAATQTRPELLVFGTACILRIDEQRVLLSDDFIARIAHRGAKVLVAVENVAIWRKPDHRRCRKYRPRKLLVPVLVSAWFVPEYHSCAPDSP